MDRVRLTKAIIESIKAPSAGRALVYDAAVPGLALRVTAAGARSWVLYRRLPATLGGRVRRYTIGAYESMPIDAARREAQRLNGKIADGIDPSAEKRASREATTFGELWALYLAKHARVHKRPRSVEEDERNHKLHLARWNSRKAAEITRKEVQALHAGIGEKSGPYAANRVLALLSKVYNFGAFDCDLPIGNPARGVKKFRERSRERFLHGDELRAFFEALRDEPNAEIRDFALLALFTGARRRNVQAMRWSDVNLTRATWTLPGEQMKNGDPLTVHLPPPAITVLRQRHRNGSKYVLPGRGGSGHLEEVKSGWSRILKRAGLSNLRPHDLRRTLGSWQAAGGTSLPIIGRALGHKNVSTTAIYARLDLSPVQTSVNTAVAAMLAAGGEQ